LQLAITCALLLPSPRTPQAQTVWISYRGRANHASIVGTALATTPPDADDSQHMRQYVRATRTSSSQKCRSAGSLIAAHYLYTRPTQDAHGLVPVPARKIPKTRHLPTKPTLPSIPMTFNGIGQAGNDHPGLRCQRQKRSARGPGFCSSTRLLVRYRRCRQLAFGNAWFLLTNLLGMMFPYHHGYQGHRAVSAFDAHAIEVQGLLPDTSLLFRQSAQHLRRHRSRWRVLSPPRKDRVIALQMRRAFLSSPGRRRATNINFRSSLQP